VGQEIDRLNNVITDIDKARENQKREIMLFDSELRKKIEQVRKNEATIEELQKAIKELESDPELYELSDKILKIEKEKDSLTFQRNLYVAQLRIEIEKHRENKTRLEDLQKDREKLESNIKTKEKSIQDIGSDKEAYKAALSFLQKQKPLSHADVNERIKNIEMKLQIKRNKKKELKKKNWNLKKRKNIFTTRYGNYQLRQTTN